jgi:uncharacterized membrane protein
MLSAILYVFAFSTWGLGLVAFISVIGINIEKWQKKKEIIDFELKEKTIFLERLTSSSSPLNMMAAMSQMSNKKEIPIPDKVKELMAKSQGHPEVEEIDGTDEIIGVRFEAENYPPGFDDDEE